MAEDLQLDPAKLMRAFFTAWDQGRAPAPGARAADPTAIEAIAPAMRLMAQALAVANMPSREDITALAARLDRIEAALGRLDQRLATLESPAAPAASAAPIEVDPAARKPRKKKR